MLREAEPGATIKRLVAETSPHSPIYPSLSEEGQFLFRMGVTALVQGAERLYRGRLNSLPPTKTLLAELDRKGNYSEGLRMRVLLGTSQAVAERLESYGVGHTRSINAIRGVFEDSLTMFANGLSSWQELRKFRRYHSRFSATPHIL